jgi:hypothetical protein
MELVHLPDQINHKIGETDYNISDGFLIHRISRIINI